MSITIKDLPESVDLDREAMLAITGGTRVGGRQTALGRTIFRNAFITNYPTTAAFKPLANAKTQLTGNKSRK
jgi:hypothetical protein